jgi:hypothetical protein
MNISLSIPIVSLFSELAGKSFAYINSLGAGRHGIACTNDNKASKVFFPFSRFIAMPDKLSSVFTT